MMSYLESTQLFKQIAIPLQIQSVMHKPLLDYHSNKYPYLIDSRVEHILQSSFNCKFGGLHVLVAPSKSGKTTYLTKHANQFIKDGGYVQYYSNELTSRTDFFTAFGDIHRSQDLFTYLPSQSAIIFDHIEQLEQSNDGVINNDLSSLLRHLTLESRRTEGNIIIVSTSSLKHAEYILNLNGNDKIRLMCQPTAFKWDTSMINTYIDRVFRSPYWNSVDIDTLRMYAYKAQSPGFLQFMHHIFPTAPQGILHICATL